MAKEKLDTRIEPLKSIVIGVVFLSACVLINVIPLLFMLWLTIIIGGLWWLSSNRQTLLSFAVTLYILICAITTKGLLNIALGGLVVSAAIGFLVYRVCFSYIPANYWAAMVNGSLFGLFGVAAVLILSSLAPAISLGDLIFNEALSTNTIMYSELAEFCYERAEISDSDRVAKTDENYEKATRQHLANAIADKMDMFPFYASGIVIFSIGFSGLVFLALSHRVRLLRSLRLSRKYGFYIAIPSIAIAAFSFFEGAIPITSIVINTAVIVPTALMFFTLELDFVARLNTTGRIIGGIVCAAVTIAACMFYAVFFVVSTIGLADAFINFRKLLNNHAERKRNRSMAS